MGRCRSGAQRPQRDVSLIDWLDLPIAMFRPGVPERVGAFLFKSDNSQSFLKAVIMRELPHHSPRRGEARSTRGPDPADKKTR